MKSLSETIQIKATEQYFPVVLFMVVDRVVSTFEFADTILNSDFSNEVFSCCVVYSTVQKYWTKS